MLLSIVQQCALAGWMMDLFGENHADAVAWAQHWGQGYTWTFSHPNCRFMQPPKVMGICQELYFSIHIFALLYILWFLIGFQLFSFLKSLSSGQHCVLISIPTCCKLTFATWRLNLAVLARIDLLIIFERCLQEAKSFHLFQCGTGNTASCVFNQIAAFIANYHRNMNGE